MMPPLIITLLAWLTWAALIPPPSLPPPGPRPPIVLPPRPGPPPPQPKQ
jgi:hypothetical protein